MASPFLAKSDHMDATRRTGPSVRIVSLLIPLHRSEFPQAPAKNVSTSALHVVLILSNRRATHD
jgi:hypothetical protein